MYPTCDVCGHTRAEHGLLGPENDKPYRRECTKTGCACLNYDATRLMEEKMAEVKTFPVELSELNDEVAVFSWGRATLGYGGFFQTTIDRKKWDDLGKPLKLRVVIFDDKE